MARPVKYETPEEMQRIIDLYFFKCKVNAQTEAGTPTTADLGDLTEEEQKTFESIDDYVPTVTGLAYALNMTRKGLIDYENKDNPEFGNTIKKAKARIEAAVEQRLFGNSVTGVIFNLKNNFGWKDKTETEHSGNLSLGGILEEIDGTSAGLPED